MLPGSIGRACSPWFAAALALAPLSAQADLVQLPPDAVPFVIHDVHGGNGLPQNTATAIVQQRDGHVLVGTLGGLCRFDGENMEVLDTVTWPGLRCNRVSCLLEARDGTLWIGSDEGGLTSVVEGHVRVWGELEYVNIQALAEDPAGRILAATSRELLRREGEHFVPVHPEVLRNVNCVYARASGELLIGSPQGAWQLDDDGLSLLASCNATCFLDGEGGLLIGSMEGLFRLASAGLEPWQPIPQLSGPIRALLRTRDGALWVGTDVRVVRIDAAAMPRTDGPVTWDRGKLISMVRPDDAQRSRTLFQDRDGGVWIGYQERGLSRLVPAEVIGRRSEIGLPRRGTVSVVGDGRGGLLACIGDGLMQSRDGRFEPVPGTAELGNCTALMRDADGSVWFGAHRGLARLDEAGLQLWCDDRDWPVELSRAIVRDQGGVLWLAGGGGLAMLQDRALVVPEVAAPLRDKPMRSLAAAPDGALWVGGPQLLARIAPDRRTMRIWHAGVDLPFGEVRTILPEAGERAWLATYGGGIVRVEGPRCLAIDERHGLFDQSLCAMVPYGDDLFLAANGGFAMLHRRDLMDVAEGRAGSLACRPLTAMSPRVAECDGAMQACAAVANGKLWFTGIECLFELDPARIQPLRRELPTKLESLFVGDQRWNGRGDVIAKAGVRTISLRLGTCAYDHHAQTRYRWRLLGHQAAWTEPCYERDVRLDNLPPGEFVFEAEAVGIDGVSSQSRVRIGLRLQPQAWETVPFWLVTGLGAVLAIALLVRFGSTRAERRSAALQALVDERTKEVRTAQQQLERRVAERTQELHTAMQAQRDEMVERQRLERELLQLQRMESLGQLAGGIAHDFNNLLTVAAGSGELLEYEVHSGEGRELCRSIREACARGRSLTQHLLAVASSQVVAPTELDLNHVVAESLPVLRSLLGSDSTLHFEAAEGPATVRAAATQVEQVLLNLIANARDAMPRGGVVRVRVQGVERSVLLSMADTGVGMSPQVVERVFEPFFTTKQAHPGRGLGLATVYGIVKQLRGEIAVDSAEGKGTTIRISLPRVASSCGEPVVVVPRPEPQRRDDRILLIEDEVDVRAVLQRLLRNLGCQVQATAGGAQAVAELRAAPAAFDAVVSDVVMPGLQGVPLVTALRAIRPDLPIVFLSGHVDGRLTHQDVHAMGLEILQKPVDQTQLAAVLERLRRSRPAPTSAP
jgi:signal transduction histidine kinase/ligand-binding sensor domain-containing protein/ActR/RegA family two-component response regulator